jgi:hypothetical protein
MMKTPWCRHQAGVLGESVAEVVAVLMRSTPSTAERRGVSMLPPDLVDNCAAA